MAMIPEKLLAASTSQSRGCQCKKGCLLTFLEGHTEEATRIYNQALSLKERCAPGASGQGASFAFNDRKPSGRNKVWGNVKVMKVQRKEASEVRRKRRKRIKALAVERDVPCAWIL